MAQITRIYTLRGYAYAEYNYNLGGKKVHVDEGVNDYDVLESTPIYMRKLNIRKWFLMQVFCDDINVHRIIWDVPVPDTLRSIPVDGWKEIPFKKEALD